MLQLGFPKVGVRLGIETLRFAHRPGIFLPGLAGDVCRLIWRSRRFARTHAGMFPESGRAVVDQIHRTRLGFMVL